MASAILIGLWIQNELGFDRFHAKENRLYLVYRSENDGGARNALQLHPESPGAHPESRISRKSKMWSACRIPIFYLRLATGILIAGQFYRCRISDYVQLSFAGRKSKYCIKRYAHDIVITESMAKKLFGNESAFGKQVKIDSVDLFTVKGDIERSSR